MGFPRKDYSARRAAFMEVAGEAYDRMFGVEEQHQLITFTQREDRVLELGQKLQSTLLQEHLQDDPLAQPAPSKEERCPDCRQASQKQSSQTRHLRARTGTAQWERAVYYCKRCRRSFSPSGHRVGSEPGRL